MLTIPTMPGFPAGSSGPGGAVPGGGLVMRVLLQAGITCPPRRTAAPGSSPAGRSPVVLHLNASHGLAPPYDAALARRQGLGPATSPKPAASCRLALLTAEHAAARRWRPTAVAPV